MLDRVLRCAAEQGLDRRTLVGAASLGDVDFSSPDGRVPVARLIALWQLLTKSPLDAGFGIRFGASARVRDFGVVGYAMYYSATLGDALRRLARFSRILSESAVFRLATEREHRIIVQPDRGLGVGTRAEVDYRLAALLAACREMTGTDATPAQVTFPYTRPASVLEHRRWFRCPLHFAHPVSSIAFVARDMQLPIARRDDTLVGYLSTHAEHVLRTLTSGGSVTERVRAALWAGLGDGRPSLSAVAMAVGLSPRTLQRRLAEDGTSVHEQLDRLREAMAVVTLRDRTIPVDDIAFLLGYAEPSTFYRSFKRWTGKTPEEYRRVSDVSRDPTPMA